MEYGYQYDYFYDSTALIAAFFEKVGIPFSIFINEKKEEILSPLKLRNGTELSVRFICSYDDYNVPVRVTVVNNVPEGKRIEALEICNKISCYEPYFDCQLTDKNNIVMAYGIMPATSMECLGSVAGNILMELKAALNAYYGKVMAAIRE